MIISLLIVSWIVGFIFGRRALIRDFGDEVPLFFAIILFAVPPVMGLTGLLIWITKPGKTVKL